MKLDSVCIDANLAIRWLLPSETYSSSARALRRQWLSQGVEMVVPSLFRAEMASTLRKYVYFKRLPPEEAEEAFSIYLDIPVRIVDGHEVYRQAWQMAKVFNLPVCYDMQYVAVAEIEDCELWTADKRLFALLHPSMNRVRLVGEIA